jgi:hypothetical protein
VALIYGRGTPLAELWTVKNSPISIETGEATTDETNGTDADVE